MKANNTLRGFTLPTLLIISTVLMIMGAAILQGTVSVKNALDDQFYNQLAREAAEAGVKFAQSCHDQGASWSELRPETNCAGLINGSAPNTVVNTETYQTTFTVGAIDERGDGSTLIMASGFTQLKRRSSGEVYRTYTEILGEATGANASTVLPETFAPNQSVHDYAMSGMLGYNNVPYTTGANSNGKLGDGTSSNKSLLEDFKLPGGLTARKMVTGNYNTFVIASNGQVYGAGDNTDGQLGDGTTNNTSASNPVRFQLPAGVFAVDLDTGGASRGSYTVVVGSNGQLYGSGDNSDRQLDSSGNDILTPIHMPLPGNARVKQATVINGENNNQVVLAVLDDGRVFGRGRNTATQLGGSSTSDTADRTSWAQLSLPGGRLGKEVQVGYYNTYILTTDGMVYGFGGGGAGALGNGGTASAYNTAQTFNLPGSLHALSFEVATSSNVSETDSNAYNSAFVVASNHQVYGAGQNHKGQLGDGTTTNRSTPVKFNLPSGLTAQKVSAMYYTTCVLASNKQVYCAGDNKYGQLGIGNTADQSTAQQFPLPSGVIAVDISVGYANVFVMGSDGNVYATGRNDAGQIGDGTTVNRSTPVVVQRPFKEVNRVVRSGSMSHVQTNVLASDGNVWSTGDNNLGQFGNGSTANKVSTPVLFQLPNGYAREVTGGVFMTQVLSSDGQLYGAGRNHRGQLGVNNTGNHSTPVQYRLNNPNMPAGLTVRDFAATPTGLGGPGGTSAGNETTLILASDNQVYGTGYNEHGQLGNGTTSQLNEPRADRRFRLPSGVTATKVYFADGADNNVSFVLGSNREMYGAGMNALGQIGEGTTHTHKNCSAGVCTTVVTPSGVKFTDATIGGYYSSYFVGTNGRPYATGYNNHGQLAVGDTSIRTTPTEMNLPPGLRVKKMEAATGSFGGSIYILASDGQVYAAGRNTHGQLGRGSQGGGAYTSLQPVQLPSGLTAVDFWPGQENVLILASNGQVYGAGRNDTGQLGTGDTNNKLTASRFLLPSGVTAQKVVTQYANRNNLDQWYFTGVLGSDGVFYVAGDNEFGQLTGTTFSFSTPRPYSVPQPADQPGILF